MTVVRYYLSFCVLLAHLSVLTGVDYPWIQRGTVDVGCFFAISGFLMFPSFQKRPTWHHYVRRRALRILPPYVLIVLLCAIFLMFVSSLPPKEYFTNPDFWKYLAANLSFMNFLQPSLPGVFEGGAFNTEAVNGSLWTMKGEWVCYLSVPVVFWLVSRLKRKGAGMVLILIALCGVAGRAIFLHLAEATDRMLYAIISKQFGTLLVFFYIGALVNFYFDEFKRYKWWILAFDLAVIALSDVLPLYAEFFQPLMAGTLVLWVSMIGSWGKWASNHDSISYDIYLFHFPIIQLAIYFGLPSSLPPLATLGIIVTVTSCLAYCSWHLVAKPIARRNSPRVKPVAN